MKRHSKQQQSSGVQQEEVSKFRKYAAGSRLLEKPKEAPVSTPVPKSKGRWEEAIRTLLDQIDAVLTNLSKSPYTYPLMDGAKAPLHTWVNSGEVQLRWDPAVDPHSLALEFRPTGMAGNENVRLPYEPVHLDMDPRHLLEIAAVLPQLVNYLREQTWNLKAQELARQLESVAAGLVEITEP